MPTINFSGSLPDLLNTNDLINLGLYTSKNSAYSARVNGHSPDYIKIGRRILYPKQSVIEFVDNHLTKNKVLKPCPQYQSFPQQKNGQ